MHYLLRRNEWMWGKPCSCCRQFEIDKAKKEETREKRAARRAARPKNPPPETVQTVNVPTLHSMITRLMNSYYGYGSAYGSMVKQ